MADNKSCEGYQADPTRPKPPKPSSGRSIGTLKVDIDCSDALTGLKAIQREAKKATAALKELEVQQDSMLDLPTHPEVSS